MDDEKLIELVRDNSVLYDSSHSKYMDSKLKLSIWNSIGDEMYVQGKQCKNRWTNIRDHFRRQLQKRKSKTGQTDENIKKYKYEDRLQFLMPYSNDRDTLTNVTLQETSVLTEPTEEDEDDHNEVEMNQLQTISSVAGGTFRGCSRGGRTQNTATPIDTPTTLLMKYIIDKDDAEKVTQEPHHVDTFLAGIASTMKKLNPYNQHIAKGRIFNVVQELECQEFFS